MHSLRTLGILALFAFLLAPVQCRRAAAGSGDPVEREAEDALVSYLRLDTSNPPGNATSGGGLLRNEGGYNEAFVDHVSFWGIEVPAKVPLWLRITVEGTAVHAASSPDDGGAIGKLVRSLDAIGRIPTPYRLTPAVARSFHE